jgi:putative restriction endonuclease
MRLYWVNMRADGTTLPEQGQNDIVAIKADARGARQAPRVRVSEIEVGDLALGIMDGEVRYLGVVSGDAYDSTFEGEECWSAPAEWFALHPPLRSAQVRLAIGAENVDGVPGSPWGGNGLPNRGYCFEIPPTVVPRLLSDLIDGEELNPSRILSTARQSGTSHIRQSAADLLARSIFRERIRNQANPKCAITGCAVLSMLDAAHILPFKDADDEAKIDPDNGILLTPSLHRAWDSGLLSIDNEGRLALVTTLDPFRAAIGLSQGPLPIVSLSSKQKQYLKRRQSVV